MTRPAHHKLELDVPISEEVLLTFLLGRYGAEYLERLGIYPDSSVIRSFEIGPDRKCRFKVCAVTLVNVEAEVEEKIKKVDTGPKVVAPTPPPAPPCATPESGGCPSQKPLRITKPEKNSNEPRGKDVSGGATLLRNQEEPHGG